MCLALLGQFDIMLLLIETDSSNRHVPMLHSLASLTCLRMVCKIDGLARCISCLWWQRLFLLGTVTEGVVGVRLVPEILFIIILLWALLGIHPPFLGNRC